MAGPVTDVERHFKDTLQDTSNLLEKVGAGSPAVRNDAIDEAVLRYSEKVPLPTVQLYTAIPSGFYTLPTNWEKWFSYIISIENPIDQTPPAFLREKDYSLIHKETGIQLYITTKPTTDFRLHYIARHTFNRISVPTTATWNAAHSSLIGKWAALIAIEWFGIRYAHSVESNNDGVNWRSKAEEMRSNAEMLQKRIDKDIRHLEIGIHREITAMKAAGWRRY